nr:MAG TPA: hypothetical protein [Caudoviricetes sp.]DAY65203.1 MAG TPA: hypothetical protein [Caudoviricetes sp.]
MVLSVASSRGLLAVESRTMICYPSFRRPSICSVVRTGRYWMRISSSVERMPT